MNAQEFLSTLGREAAKATKAVDRQRRLLADYDAEIELQDKEGVAFLRTNRQRLEKLIKASEEVSTAAEVLIHACEAYEAAGGDLPAAVAADHVHVAVIVAETSDNVRLLQFYMRVQVALAAWLVAEAE